MIAKAAQLLGLTGRRASLGRRIAMVLVLAAVITGAVTAGVFFSGDQPIGVILALLQLNIAILLVLAAVVGFKLAALWRARLRGAAGSGLHRSLALMFGLVAVAPAVLVAVLAAAFLNYGFQGWFSERIKTAVEQSNTVAQAYLGEHVQNIRAVAFSVAADVDANAAKLLGAEPAQVAGFLTAQADIRGLAEAVLVDGGGRIIARSAFSQSFALEDIDAAVLETARRTGETVVSAKGVDDRVRAFVRLNRFVDAYLVVGRLIDTGVLESVRRVEGAVSRYRALESERAGLQITFTTIFIIAALLTLSAAVWMGLIFSERLAEPIRSMAAAAERVGEGDFEARVDVSGPDELATLGAAFNRMAEEIAVQQSGLMDANRELDERRQFIETVLGGVTAGVIGLDAEERVRFPNRSASILVGESLDAHIGRPLGEIVPEMAGLPDMIAARPDRPRELEIKLRRGAAVKTLLVRVAGERVEGSVIGYVVTFDDITELQSAQRKAAWADVARRIAHEIKNPLTPIQLSAERLRRRFIDRVGDDREIFEQCVNTITRQVSEIGAMADEFSAFARMPQVRIETHDVAELCREAAFMEQGRAADIEVVLDVPEKPLHADCDRTQISRALVNLMKNASEAIETARHAGACAAGEGRIELSAAVTAGGPGGEPWVRLGVADTGAGLPKENRDRLIEPYVTHRQKGTGLGLAIVKKIAEDHSGLLTLGDRPGGGAEVSITFPVRRAGAGTGAGANANAGEGAGRAAGAPAKHAGGAAS